MSTLAILLFFFGAVAAERDTTPVFILDFEKVLNHVNIKPNPFTKMKSSDFANIIDSAIKLSEVVIVFVEVSFCFEDISVKDKHGTPFYHLRQSLKENQAKFLPAVSQPFGTLKQKFHYLDFNIFYIDDLNAKLKIYDRKLKHFYVYFKDRVNETRANSLRRHDLLMREVYFVVRQIAKSPITAFYTGKKNPIAIDNFNFKPVKTYQVPRQPGVVISSTGAMFKFIGVYATIGSRRSMFSQIPLVAAETWAEGHLITRMAYTDFELEFNFDFKKDRWIIDSVVLLERGEEVGRTRLRVGAQWAWSYTCSDPLVLVNLRDGSSLTISQYQLQPFPNSNYMGQYHGLRGPLVNSTNSTGNLTGNSTGNSTGNDTRCFGPAVDCGPYFNSQIVAGLMVSFLILGIIFYGVMSLYDCRGNDRYEDQYGKALVIAFEGRT